MVQVCLEAGDVPEWRIRHQNDAELLRSFSGWCPRVANLNQALEVLFPKLRIVFVRGRDKVARLFRYDGPYRVNSGVTRWNPSSDGLVAEHDYTRVQSGWGQRRVARLVAATPARAPSLSAGRGVPAPGLAAGSSRSECRKLGHVAASSSAARSP